MSNPPVGTITFLFTDIEGSTRLWEEYPKQMGAALARHDEILRAAIEAYDGYVFKTVGDAFCASFASPVPAVLAALATQRNLDKEDWGETGPIRVRSAIHTGLAESRDGDYFGQPLNRVARILSTAYGGQILLSDPTCDLIRDDLPLGVGLLDLGMHRLKDLQRPEHLFQLVVPDLQGEFPPLKSLDNRPNNLPVERGLLIGREHELEQARQLLLRPDVGVLSLTGPGGTGKTRLALQLAADLIELFEDGVFLVNLAPLTDSALVVSTIAQTIGVKEAADRPLLSSLKDYLKTRHMLLLLDNFEQVIDAASDVAQLLAECAHLKILATTRIALHIRGEQEYAVPPLALPDPEQLPPASKLAEYEAVALFVERARAVNPDFDLNDDNANAIGAICVRLDGLPLAIELAAARVRLLPPQAMLARLEHSLKLLTGGARDLPARQQTLRNAIEWSYDLLDAGEKQLFRRLAVFVGGRTLQAIEEICNADGDLQVDVLDGVDSLVSKSLMQQREGPQIEPRFWMLETIHEYARETLEESGEAEALRSRHARYFVQLAEQAESQLRSARQAGWLDRLEAEHDNFRAVLRWSFETGQTETAARAAGALWRFWHVRGYLSEGRRHLARVLEQPTLLPVALRAKVLYGAGRLALVQGDYSAALVLDSQSLTAYRDAGDRLGEANLLNELGNVAGLQGNFVSRRGLHEDALRIFRELNDKPGIGAALFQLANVTALGGDYEKATPLMEESLEMLRLAGDKRGIALSLYSLGNYKRELGDYDDAIARYDECLLISRELGDRWSIANTLRSLGTVACDQGRFEQAGKLLEEGLEIFRKLEARRGVADSLSNLGEVALQLGDYDRSQALLQESLSIRRELGNKPGTVECLESLARLACAREQWTLAAMLFGSAAALRGSMHAPLTPADNVEQDRLIATVRLNTGDAAWQEAWDRGASASLDDIISLALDQQL